MHCARQIYAFKHSRTALKNLEITVLAGKGNNGGDGILTGGYLARHFNEKVTVYSLQSPSEMSDEIRRHFVSLPSDVSVTFIKNPSDFPNFNKPCVIVDRARLASVLPSELVCPEGGDALSALGDLCEETRKRVVLIPASTATGEGMLVGLRAERIVIEAGGKKREADAVIALSDIEAGALVPSCLLV